MTATTTKTTTLGTMLLDGQRGDFAQALMGLYVAPCETALRVAYSRADEQNGPALCAATKRVVASVDEVSREADALRVSLAEEFLALALANALGTRERLAQIPLRAPLGWDRSPLDSLHIPGPEGVFLPEYNHMWGTIERHFGDLACLHNGEVWQYMGSFLHAQPVGWLHDFRHRHLPDSDGYTYVRIPASEGWQEVLRLVAVASDEG